MSKPNYETDRAIQEQLRKAAEAYNSVLQAASAAGLIVHTEVDGSAIYPRTWREVA